MATLTLDGLERTFPGGHVGVDGVDLTIAHGELLVLVGPSGCGKSTLLRLIAGLDVPTRGRIAIDGVDVTAEPAQARDLAMVFQSYALYPHMSVRENLAYGLKVRGVSRLEVGRRIADTAGALDLAELLDRRPGALSGGQRQRVALGRAMVREPRAFLLDEPLSNLDPALRVQARAELLRLQRRLGATMVYVTHDQEDAMTLGARVAVMRAGRIEQVASPLDVYRRPANTFVARFIGSPTMNLLAQGWAAAEAPVEGLVGVRPHDVVVGDGPFAGTVEVVEARGHDAVIHLRTSGHDGELVLAVISGVPPAVGATVRFGLPADRRLFFDKAGQRWHPPAVAPQAGTR